MNDNNRPTGRTTLTLRAALSAARRGEYVVVVMPKHKQVRYAAEIVQQLATPTENAIRTDRNRSIYAGVKIASLGNLSTHELRGRTVMCSSITRHAKGRLRPSGAASRTFKSRRAPLLSARAVP